MGKKEYYQDSAERLDLRYIDNARPRESKTQESQLDNSEHVLNSKDVKTPIESKIEGDVKKKPVSQATDSDLQNKVQGVFHNDINLASYDIRVYCNQNQIEITGVVDSLSEKEYAQKLVQSNFNLPVINNVSISTDGHIVDKDVEQELIEELNIRNLDYKDLDIKVNDGVVTIYGETNNQIREVMDAIKTARGVTQVQNLTSHKEQTLDDIFHSQVNNDKED